MGELHNIARRLMERGKGILAADESIASAGTRLASVGVPSTPENRRRYRDLFLSAKGIEAYLSGVILFEESAHQRAADGTPFSDLLTHKGILPGIKVDLGLEGLPGHATETYTQGLEHLETRLAEYWGMGLRFAKWRAAFSIGEGVPSVEAIHVNVEIMAKYAALCQAANIVPIVEPEVLITGSHDLATAERITSLVLRGLFDALEGNQVDLSATILKTSMAIAGDRYDVPSSPQEVGEATSRMLLACVPPDTAGVVFLSGGQKAVQATANLNEVARRGPYAWPVTFSYARALQGPALEVWRGQEDRVEEARAVFLRRLELNALASLGLYEGE